MDSTISIYRLNELTGPLILKELINYSITKSIRYKAACSVNSHSGVNSRLVYDPFEMMKLISKQIKNI
jgi:hypothetical protein